MKKVDYSETITACDLKLIDSMTRCEFMIGPMSFINEDLTFFSQKPPAHLQPNFECKLVDTS